ncbi:CheR family methyltransferase [Roseomonas elaeocarpi]|uniref:protein-glutamate O-methyltransferase n=1 Tax=Roseomonas elaeocarpi TaxID=907779 RepID=A0ABV6JPP6_9PROT
MAERAAGLPAVSAAARLPPPDAGFAALKRRIIARTGHHYYEDKDSLLWERVLRRMRATGAANSESYLRRLEDERDGPAEWRALEATITIGETFFFRYAEQFAALRDTILPDILARNAATRRLRIWSAGCATGAEPYSVAILLHQLLGDRLAEWRCSILGTDINEEFLRTAREARFGDWALRTMSLEERERDFIASADRRSWQLRPQFRGMVRFERANLLDLLGPSMPLQFSEFDLILCRNVLIYFQHEVVTRIVRALGERLSSEGWMLLGHAEPNLAFAAFLKVEALPGTVAYRPGGAASTVAPPDAPEFPPAATPPLPALPLSPRQPVVVAAPVAEGHDEQRDAASPELAPADASATMPESAEEMVRAVRALADDGTLDAARTACREGLARHPDCAALHYYDAMTAWGQGEETHAETAFRRALYLDPGFVMAHYQLGLLLLTCGRTEAGRRRIAGAARIARALPAQGALAEADGMTAAGLYATAQLHLGQSGGQSGTAAAAGMRRR